MAAKLIESNGFLTCCICLNKYFSLKSLPCLHTFCRLCLKAYIVTKVGGQGKKSIPFPCPLCRRIVTVSDPNLTSENIADTLPDYHFTMSSIEGSRSLDKSILLCDPCYLGDQEKEATTWCTYCTEAFCEKCTSIHKRLKKKEHKLVPINELSKQQPSDLLERDAEPCSKHNGKIYEVYCVDHKELYCVICLATQHKGCKHIISTSGKMANLPENTKLLEHFTACLEEMDKKASGLLTETEEIINCLESRRQEILEQVSSIVQQTHKTLDMMHSSFQEKFQQIHQEQNGQLKDRKEQISDLLNHIKENQTLLDVIRQQGSAEQLFINQENLKSQLKDREKKMKEDLKGVKFVDYTLKMNDITIPVRPGSPSPTLAEIDVKSRLDFSGNLGEVFDLVHSFSDIESVNIEKINVFNVASVVRVGDKFTGGTYLPDGRIVFCNYSSKKFLVFSESGQYLFKSPTLDKHPHDACCMSASEIVVSFYDSNWLKKYEVTQNFKEIMTIKCSRQYHPKGLAVTQNTLIVGYKDRIDVLSMDGGFIKTLSSRNGDLVSYVTVSPSGGVYYSDGDCVVCKTLDGNELRRYTHPELRGILGIGLDRYDNVYVCGYYLNNVCIFSPDGNAKRLLIQDMRKPYKIGFDQKRENFFVAQNDGGKIFSCQFE